jgi:putative endopeptidase
MHSFLPRRAGALALLLLVPVLAQAAELGSGVQKKYMDTTCPPCSDFFKYAVGSWYDTVQIPPSYTSLGAGRELFDRNQVVLKEVLDKAAANAGKEKDPTLKKLGDLYAVLMDSVRANREGIGALKAELDFIDGIQDAKGIQKALERYTLYGGSFFGGAASPIRVQPEVDPKNSAMTIAQLFQGGLGLPERDFYFRDDPKSVDQRNAYVEAAGKMLALAGTPADKAKADAAAILKLETALAESSMTRLQMRDPHALYNKIPVSQLRALAPNIDWATFFPNIGLPALASPTAELDVSQPAFVRQFSQLMTSTPIDTWRAYFRWTVLRRNAGWLGDEAFAIGFALQSKFTGAKEPQPRWKRATQTVDGAMGEALGKAYVAQAFPPSSKARMVDMVANLRAAFAERIASRAWMSDATKAAAKKKLEAIVQKIGYPDTWRDYGPLAIDPKRPAVENLYATASFEARRQLGYIGKAPDRTEWGMSPPTVNAYYNPPFNEIVFPAGILQPPRFDATVDDAFNYGAIGMVIGHELTHGFDDEGRKYDAAGNLEDWWTDEDGKKFEELAAKVVSQYDGYVGVDTLHVNGKLTLGENIADLGGLTVAYHAWKRSLKGKPSPVIDGFTGEQRFFLGHAQAWRNRTRDESLRQQILTDPHSPSRWRVNGPLSNMSEFREAFGCKDGDAMVRGDQIVIW